MVDAIELIMRYGSNYVFVPILVDGNYNETTMGYRENLTRWIDWGIASETALEDYARLDWQVRLHGTEYFPALVSAAERLIEKTTTHSQRFVWFTIMPNSKLAWELVFRTILKHNVTTYHDAIVALYGQTVPTEDVLLLDFGKPQLFTSAVPPLLICKMHCYWRQSLGYSLTEQLLRRILYDFAYNRPTWLSDKTGRADHVTVFAQAYANDLVLGEGIRLGPFWYPKTIDAVIPGE